MKILMTFALVVTAACLFGQSRVKLKVPVYVKDIPEVAWVGMKQDTVRVGMNNFEIALKVTSRLKLENIELLVNQIVVEKFGSSDLQKLVLTDSNKYEQVVERMLSLRTGFNNIDVVARNVKGRGMVQSKVVLVDPSLMDVVMNKNDRNAPQLYIASPPNIRNDYFAYSGDIIQIRGSVFDDSGIKSLRINNIETPVKLNGAFVISLPLSHGKNHVTIEATDVNQNISQKRFVIERRALNQSEVQSMGAAKNYLFVVGINEYQHLPKLNNAVKDAQDLVRILTHNYTFDSTLVTVLTNAEATRNNIYNGLRDLIEKVTPNDNLMIYFSGHGLYDDLLKEGYWIPVEGNLNSAGEYIANSTILKIIENIDSKHTFLVADACFSGSLFTSSVRGYVDNIEKYRSRWGLASGRLEFVSDGDPGANSPFAGTLLSFLRDNKSPKIAVSEVVQFVKTKVTEQTDQTPYGNPLRILGDEGGEFVFYLRTQN